MKNLLLFVLIIIFSCQNPLDLNKKINIPKIDKIFLNEKFQIYVPRKNSFGDSILKSIHEFRDLKVSIEDLTKLNPSGIESFLDETLIKCDNLLSSKNSFISRPEIRGRLKVLKTNILKCKFNNHQNDTKNLNKSLENLFLSYNILLEKIEDFK